MRLPYLGQCLFLGEARGRREGKGRGNNCRNCQKELRLAVGFRGTGSYVAGLESWKSATWQNTLMARFGDVSLSTIPLRLQSQPRAHIFYRCRPRRSAASAL